MTIIISKIIGSFIVIKPTGMEITEAINKFSVQPDSNYIFRWMHHFLFELSIVSGFCASNETTCHLCWFNLTINPKFRSRIIHCHSIASFADGPMTFQQPFEHECHCSKIMHRLQFICLQLMVEDFFSIDRNPQQSASSDLRIFEWSVIQQNPHRRSIFWLQSC